MLKRALFWSLLPLVVIQGPEGYAALGRVVAQALSAYPALGPVDLPG